MKRFWKAVTVDAVPGEAGAGGWTVLLDGRPVKTPARNACVVPRRRLAEAIAAEWDGQETEIRPLEMPMTRAMATCLDRVTPEVPGIRAAVAAYGGTDLLCYRADRPEGLVARQAEGWDPLLDWAAEAHGARLVPVVGVMPVTQSPAALERLAAAVARHDAWALTALAELTTISGSLVLALAVEAGRLGAAEAWALSRIDEQWNVEEWGDDHDAARLAERRRGEFLHAARVLELLAEAVD